MGEQRVAGGDVKQIALRMPREEYEALRVYANVAGIRSMNEAIVLAVREFLSAKGRRTEFEGLLKRAQSQYRVALDKLADL